MHPSCAGLPAVPEGDWYCPEHTAATAAKSKAAKADKGAAAAAAAPKKKKVLKKLKDIEGGNAPADAKAKQKGSNKKRERSDSGADQSGEFSPKGSKNFLQSSKELQTAKNYSHST